MHYVSLIVSTEHLNLLLGKLSDIHSKWERFGRALPLNDVHIDDVKANVREQTQSKSNRAKLEDTLIEWKNNGGKRTWGVIHNAAVGRKDLADDIKESYDLESDGIYA